MCAPTPHPVDPVILSNSSSPTVTRWTDFSTPLPTPLPRRNMLPGDNVIAGFLGDSRTPVRLGPSSLQSAQRLRRASSVYLDGTRRRSAALHPSLPAHAAFRTIV